MLTGFQWACQGKQCEKYGKLGIGSQPVSCLEQYFMTLKQTQCLTPFSSVLGEHIKSSCSPGRGGDIGNKAEEILEVYPGAQMAWGGPQSGELK